MEKKNFVFWVTLICCTLIFYLTSSLFFIDNANASPIKVGTFSLRNYSLADKYSTLQGSTIVGNSLYVTCSKSKTEEDGTALLMEIDLSTFELIRSAELPLYHANNVTYNPNYNGKAVLIIPHTATNSANPRTVSIVDLKTFTILENKILSKYVDNLSYDPINHIYIGAGARKLVVFDEQFKYIESYPLQIEGYTQQGSEIYNNLRIQAYSSSSSLSQNALFLYDDSGKMVKKYGISDDYGELESCISVGNGDVILGFNNWKSKKISLDFYKGNLNTTSEETESLFL